MSRKTFAAVLILGCTCANSFAQPPDKFLGKNAQTWLGELEKDNATARRGAAFALGKLEAGSALSALENHLLTDKDVWVREAAAFALGEIGRSTTNDKLLPTLKTALAKDESPTVRRSAAFALGCLGKDASSALPQLEEALKDDSALVRQSAGWALAKLGAPAIEAVKKALRDKDSLVKRDVATSLEPCIVWNKQYAKGVVPLEIKEARPLVPDLAELCREDDSDVRRAALGVLIKLVNGDDGKYIRLIASALTDQDEEVRTYAALTMSNIGGKDAAKAVKQLIKALNQEASIDLRQQAAMGLYNIGPEAKEAVPHLIKALKYRDEVRDKDGDVRTSAALALGGIGSEAQMAYESLLQMAEDTKEKSGIREEAAYALQRLGKCPAADQSVKRILKVVGDAKEPINVRTRIMWNLHVHYLDDLRRMGIYPTLYNVLSEPKSTDRMNDNKMLRYDCAVLLGHLQQTDVQPDVLKTLLEFLRDKDVAIHVGKTSSVGGVGKETGTAGGNVSEGGRGDGRVLAAKALEKIGYERLADQPEIIAELRSLAADNSTYEGLRTAATELLKKLKK
jgi:HEAT repeat protein